MRCDARLCVCFFRSCSLWCVGDGVLLLPMCKQGGMHCVCPHVRVRLHNPPNKPCVESCLTFYFWKVKKTGLPGNQKFSSSLSLLWPGLFSVGIFFYCVTITTLFPFFSQSAFQKGKKLPQLLQRRRAATAANVLTLERCYTRS